MIPEEMIRSWHKVAPWRSEAMVEQDLIIIKVFNYYCDRTNESISRAMFEKNLSLKSQHKEFLDETNQLISDTSLWRPKEAFALVSDRLISKLAGDPWKVEVIA